MRFTKMQGTGNDYVFVDCFKETVDQPSRIARDIADRHTGIGSDGLILIKPADRADVRMEMYNADGSRAQMCGNGIRCVAKYAVEHGLAGDPALKIETGDGVKVAWCELVGSKVDRVRVDMGKPLLDPTRLPCTIDVLSLVDHPLTIRGREHRVTCVSMGNPHAVVFTDDVHRIDLVDVGPAFEYAPIFPERINTHFVRVDSLMQVTVRTWERGSGATRACGTGACAVCVAGVLTKRTQRRIAVALPGGDLDVEWSAEDDHVYMTGPAVEVFTGEWQPPAET